jgi:hypothetical protein
MRGERVYGVLFTILVLVCFEFAAQPQGQAVFFGLVTLQAGVWAANVWRRAGLTLMAGGFGLAAVGMALFGMLALRGHLVPFLPVGWWIVLGLVFTGSLLCHMAEKRRDPEAYALVREHEREGSFWDIVLGRFPRPRGIQTSRSQ